MTQQKEYTWQDLESAVGQDFAGGITRTGADSAERGAIRKFCEAVEMDCPLFHDDEAARGHGYPGIIAPVSMINQTLTTPPVWMPGEDTRWGRPERNALFPRERDQGGRTPPPIPAPQTTAGFATDVEIEYFTPVCVGDQLTVTGQKLVSVAVKETSVGYGAFTVFENEIYNQRGDLVARTRNGGYRYNPHPGGGQAGGRRGGSTTGQPEQRSVPPARASAVDWSVQRYFEDVNEGDEVPPVTINLTVQRLVIEAGANYDFAPIHHNTEISQAQGAPEMYANNVFIQSMWNRTVQEFIGLDGRIKKVGPFRMRIFNCVGDSTVTKGTVKRKWQEGGENLVELEIWSENSRGVSVGPGPVLVALPSRG